MFNRAAGIEVISVQASIMQKVPYAALNDVFNPAYYYDASFPSAPCFNLMRAQVMTGALEVDPYDSGNPALTTPDDDFFLIHTPFMNAGCFPQMAFNAYTGDLIASPVFVRIVAKMKRIGASPTDAPIYFVQDYAPDVVQGPVATSSQFWNINAPTPYGLYQAPRPAYDMSTIDNGIVNQTAVLSSTVFAFNTSYDAPVELNFTSTSSTTLFPPGIQNRATLTAGNSISIQGEMSVTPGNEFSATVGRTAFIQCPILAILPAGPSFCTPNTLALRPGSTAALPTVRPLLATVGLELAPNPASGSTTALLRGEPEEYIQAVEILNSNGQRIWLATRLPETHEREVSIPLTGIRPGLYFVRLVSTSRVYSQKLQVE